jgi:hypothetical protein
MAYIVKKCKLCNQDFVDQTKSSNKLFCSTNHKSSFTKKKHAEKVKLTKAIYYKNNKEKIAADHLRWMKSKFKAVSEGTASAADINFVIRNRVRTRLLKILRESGTSKNSSVTNLIGCSIDQLRDHLESKFVEGMGWGNRSEWHIDHIIPLSSFDLSDPEQLAKACHYTNLQPLWAADNIAKGGKLPEAL